MGSPLFNPMRYFITVDLGYGDCGKGKIVSYLVRRESIQLIVRYGGGSQCAHNVYDKGKHHTFAQFGSSLDPGVRTLLSKHVLVNPLSILKEEEYLRQLEITDALERLYIDAEAKITTPYHRALNRIKELARGSSRHGSCGMGIGETAAYAIKYPQDVIYAGDLRDRGLLLAKLSDCHARLRSDALTVINTIRDKDPEIMRQYSTFSGEPRELVARYREFAARGCIIDHKDASKLIADESVVFEGHQGVLLDENYGFHPYTTWSTTTIANARALIREGGNTDAGLRTIGVLRTYATRHGPGPFVSERRDMAAVLSEPNNGFGLYQREFRIGAFDVPVTKYALRCNGNLVDELAMTHCDRLEAMEDWPVCTDYDRNEIYNRKDKVYPLEEQEKFTLALFDTGGAFETVKNVAFLPWVESQLYNIPVKIISTGPDVDQTTTL